MPLGKTSQVCLALALPCSVVLAYYLYKRLASTDEEVYGKKRVVTSRNSTIEVAVPHKAVGTVIGRQGARIKEIQKESGARVTFKDRGDVTAEAKEGSRTAIIQGTPESAQQAELMIYQIIAEMPQILTEVVDVPIYSIGRIIGKNGSSIREMCRISGAKINIEQTDKSRSPDELQGVTLSGSRQQIDLALEMLEDRLELEEEARNRKTAGGRTSNARVERQRIEDRSEHRKNTVVEHPKKKEKVSLKAKPVTPADASWDELEENRTPKQDNLPLKESFLEVCVSAVEHPGHFWVQQLGTSALHLEQLQHDLTDFATSQDAQQYKVTEATKDLLVAARYTEEDGEDGIFYRAKVVGETSDGRLDLYFVDFGDNAYKQKADVVRLRDDFTDFPFQAIECCLAGVTHTGDEWSDESITLFEDLTFCAQWKVIFAKVIPQGQVKATSQGHNMPALRLVDTSGEKDVDIGQEMIDRGFAVSIESLPKTSPFPSTNGATPHQAKIPSVPSNTEAKNLLNPPNIEAKNLSEPSNIEAKNPLEPSNTEVKRPSEPSNIEAKNPLEPSNSEAKRPSEPSNIAIHRYGVSS